jgi:hypothetical protein
MALTPKEFGVYLEKEKRKEEAKKKRKERRFENFLKEHGEEIIEIEEPLIFRGKATTTKIKITRNELAKLQAWAYSEYDQKILMKLRPKKSK